LLTATIPYGSLPEQFAQLSPLAIKFIVLINPTIMLMIAVLVGTLLYDKVNLTVPTISSLLKNGISQTPFVHQLKYGTLFGVLAGIVIVLVVLLFGALIPQEFEALANKMEVTLLVRFGYGGITEELLLRFGFMTLVVWITSKIAQKLNAPIYWIGIVISTLLFATGHLPVVYESITHPSFLMVSYVLIGNSVGGLIYGWLYWKKGLEAACIAHIFSHVVMVLGTLLFNT